MELKQVDFHENYTLKKEEYVLCVPNRYVNSVWIYIQIYAHTSTRKKFILEELTNSLETEDMRKIQ